VASTLGRIHFKARLAIDGTKTLKHMFYITVKNFFVKAIFLVVILIILTSMFFINKYGEKTYNFNDWKQINIADNSIIYIPSDMDGSLSPNFCGEYFNNEINISFEFNRECGKVEFPLYDPSPINYEEIDTIISNRKAKIISFRHSLNQ